MTYKAYVDGSYINDKVGYGAILLHDGDVIAEFSGEVTQHTESRQVAGELVATMTVLDYCQQHHIDSVHIYYDYKGIELWATGRRKTNKTLTRNYAKTVRESNVSVTWHKVKAHSGNQWNDKADELAKQGAGYDASAPKPKQPSAGGDDALLAAIGEAFTHHLNENGIHAEFDRVLNNQYARIIMMNGNKRAGYFDLYNTKNRPLDPYIHALKNKSLKYKLESLWQAYKANLDV